MGNIFLPIIWKGKRIVYPGPLETAAGFDEWINSQLAISMSKLDKSTEGLSGGKGGVFTNLTPQQKPFYDYAAQNFSKFFNKSDKFKALGTILLFAIKIVSDIIYNIWQVLTYPVQPVASRLPEISTSSFTSISLPQSSTQPRFQVPAFLQNDDPREALVLPAEPISSTALQNFPMLELIKVYLRLKEAFRVNGLVSSFTYPKNITAGIEDLTHTDVLAKGIGYSISAVEIAQRGVQSNSMRSSLLDKISPQSLSHLRIYSETVSSYLAIGNLRYDSDHTGNEYSRTQVDQLNQLFIGHPGIFDANTLPYDLKNITPLIMQDPFIFLCETAVFLIPAFNLDITHVLRLCYLAEMVRVVLAYAAEGNQLLEHMDADHFINAEKVNHGTFSSEQLDNLLHFVAAILNISRMGSSATSLDNRNMSIPARFQDPKFLYCIYTLASTYALPFVRKAAILMHIRYGVELPPVSFDRIDEPELERLSSQLKLPSLHEMLASFANNTSSGHMTRSVVGGWLRHWLWFREGRFTPASISLPHPAIFELVGLPKNYDTLTDEAIRRKCPTTGKELTDPALCLFCGEIMCSQGVCCMTDKNRGGCNQHQAKCGGNIGLFIHIRKCMVLFLNHDHGTWYAAPYLDKHGETDPTLRRHHQLFLNQKRYDILLRKVWLEGGIQSFIARRLEGDINNGGWETM